MAQDWTNGFYQSKEWEKCRAGFMQSKNYICEICGSPATICHHKTHLTPANINDPQIALNWENLQAVCQECHNKIHMTTSPTQKGLTFDKHGNLIKTPQLEG